MSTVTCPHCGAINAAGAAFCEACGKAVPPAGGFGGPRVVSTTDLPQTAAGSQMLGDQLLKHTKRAVTTLLVVGLIQVVIGTLLGVAMMNMRGVAREQAVLTIGIMASVGLIFIGLSFWARRSALPASIVGLVLYATLIVINVVSNASAMAEAGPEARGRGLGGLGVGWLDIVIVIFLVQGIKAALEHRKLLAAESSAS